MKCKIFILFGIIAFCFCLEANDKKYLAYSFTLKNESALVVTNVELLVFAPVPTTSVHICSSISSSHKFVRVNDETGNQMLKFSFPFLPPYAIKNIKVKVNILTNSHPKFEKNYDEIIQFSKVSPMTDFQNNEFKFNSDFKSLSKSKKVEFIVDWLRKNMKHSPYSDSPKGANFAWENKKGDCTEFMYLAMAICRSQGIYTKAVSGFICKKNMIILPSNYHDWFIWFDDEKWQIADAFVKSNLYLTSDYIATHLHKWPETKDSSAPLFFCKGKGVTAEMNFIK